MDLSHCQICDYCGELINASTLNFQGANDAIICATCVKWFQGILSKHEEEKKVRRSKVMFYDPMPDHNFVVLPGGKK